MVTCSGMSCSQKDQPPAIIDWAVYFRPAEWAHAVAIVDALTWHDVDPGVLGRHHDVDHEQWTQMLIRALMFRIGTSEGQVRAGMPSAEADSEEAAHRYRNVVERVLARV